MVNVAITDLIPDHAIVETRDLGYIFGKYTNYDTEKYHLAFREWANIIEEIFHEDLGIEVKISMERISP
jgi:hypothetical protein